MKKKQKHHCENKDKCFALLQAFIDGEVPLTDTEDLLKKIEECEPCFKYYNLEACIKDTLQKKVNRKEAPADLIESIKIHIRNSA